MIELNHAQVTQEITIINVPSSNCFRYLLQFGGQLVAHPTFDFSFSSPVRRLDQPQGSGGLGEHCLSTWPRSGSCELRSPACLWLIEGTAQRRQTGVAFFLVTFSWRRKKK
jgi:hypothetical protein